jgi:hypothetical protein
MGDLICLGRVCNVCFAVDSKCRYFKKIKKFLFFSSAIALAF